MAYAFDLWQEGDLLQQFRCDPVLESWNNRTHPDQLRLKAYLDDVAERLDPLPETSLLSLALTVRLKRAEHLLNHHDLENYLTPLARRLGAQLFNHIRACKQLAGDSEIRIGRAVPLLEELSSQVWRCFACRVQGGAQEKWKPILRDALAETRPEPLPPGPVAVHLAWRISSKRRNWLNLWKPTGDAMGPVLGYLNERSPFNPADDRITELHLHQTRDDSLGNDFVVGMWWRSLPS